MGRAAGSVIDDLLDGVEDSVEDDSSTNGSGSLAVPDQDVDSGQLSAVSHKKLQSIPGVSIIEFNQKISQLPLEKIKFTTSHKTLAAVISPNAIALRTHYSDATRKFLCFDGECCQDHGLPKLKYLLPAFVYETSDNGGVLSENLSLKILTLGPTAYEQFMDIHHALAEDGSSADRVDILITCTDEKYQNVNLIPRATNKWRSFKDKSQVIKLIDHWKKNSGMVHQVEAKSLDPDSYKRLMNAAPRDSDGQSGVSVDDFDLKAHLSA